MLSLRALLIQIGVKQKTGITSLYRCLRALLILYVGNNLQM